MERKGKEKKNQRERIIKLRYLKQNKFKIDFKYRNKSSFHFPNQL